MWWDRMVEWLPWHRHRLPVPELDAALAANVAAHLDIAREEASLGDKLADQQHKTDDLLTEIRRRAERGRQPNPTLVTIAHALKSLETP